MAKHNERLVELLSPATSLRGTAVGGFEPRHRGQTRDLLQVSRHDELKHLIELLSFDEDSLGEHVSLMTPGDIQLNFLAGHKPLASIVLILPQFLRWDALPHDARLLDPPALEAWLAAHGWQSPGSTGRAQ